MYSLQQNACRAARSFLTPSLRHGLAKCHCLKTLRVQCCLCCLLFVCLVLGGALSCSQELTELARSLSESEQVLRPLAGFLLSAERQTLVLHGLKQGLDLAMELLSMLALPVYSRDTLLLGLLSKALTHNATSLQQSQSRPRG